MALGSGLIFEKSGIDFELAPLPGVGGNPGMPFVGVLTALINRSSPNGDFAVEFLEKYVCTMDGLRAIDAEAPLGVPALKALADEMSAKNPLIKGDVRKRAERNGDAQHSSDG